jgi:exoribonuclease R
MLPKELCMICSLLPGDDKLAFSVFWEISPEAEIVSHYFTRSVIRSSAQLAYEHAQVNYYFFEAYKGISTQPYLPVLQQNFFIHKHGISAFIML